MPGRPPADEALDNKVAEHAVELLARKRDVRPLTVGFLQSVSASLGHNVGEHRASRMVAHLRHLRLLVPSGRYRGKHGFWVTIYRLRSVTASVRRKGKVKSRAWWKHPLFGNPNGKKPRFVNKETLGRWRSDSFWWEEQTR